MKKWKVKLIYASPSAIESMTDFGQHWTNESDLDRQKETGTEITAENLRSISVASFSSLLLYATFDIRV